MWLVFDTNEFYHQTTKNTLSELEKREKRAMERKISEMEEELKVNIIEIAFGIKSNRISLHGKHCKSSPRHLRWIEHWISTTAKKHHHSRQCSQFIFILISFFSFFVNFVVSFMLVICWPLTHWNHTKWIIVYPLNRTHYRIMKSCNIICAWFEFSFKRYVTFFICYCSFNHKQASMAIKSVYDAFRLVLNGFYCSQIRILFELYP